MKYIEVVDITGRVWASDPDKDGEVTEAVVAELTEAWKDFSNIATISLVIDGTKVWFNLANLIAWAIKDDWS